MESVMHTSRILITYPHNPTVPPGLWKNIAFVQCRINKWVRRNKILLDQQEPWNLELLHIPHTQLHFHSHHKSVVCIIQYKDAHRISLHLVLNLWIEFKIVRTSITWFFTASHASLLSNSTLAFSCSLSGKWIAWLRTTCGTCSRTSWYSTTSQPMFSGHRVHQLRMNQHKKANA